MPLYCEKSKLRLSSCKPDVSAFHLSSAYWHPEWVQLQQSPVMFNLWKIQGHLKHRSNTPLWHSFSNKGKDVFFITRSCYPKLALIIIWIISITEIQKIRQQTLFRIHYDFPYIIDLAGCGIRYWWLPMVVIKLFANTILYYTLGGIREAK